MATKKQNRRFARRRVRRVLNRTLDFIKTMSGRRLNRNLYGTGLHRRIGERYGEDDVR